MKSKLSFIWIAPLLAAVGLFASSPARSQNGVDNPQHTGYHGEGYINFVDPDRQRVGFTDLQGDTYTLDTYSAMAAYGYPADLRDYSAVGALLQRLGSRPVRLGTNNPEKTRRVRAAGIAVLGVTGVVTALRRTATATYLATKRDKGGHDYNCTEMTHHLR